jgi:hypothetical protein
LPNDLAALAVSGVAGLAVIGLLVFRMRAALIRLRQSHGETATTAASNVPAVPSTTPLSSTVPDVWASESGQLDAPAQDLPESRTATAGSGDCRPDEAFPPILTRDMLPPWPAYPDATGPLPIFDEVVRRRYPQQPGIQP